VHWAIIRVHRFQPTLTDFRQLSLPLMDVHRLVLAIMNNLGWSLVIVGSNGTATIGFHFLKRENKSGETRSPLKRSR